ncbi:hypothetical protein GCM10023094_07210 [Rhodococcus olei]|uniref:Uncharacterized protein n=1 Tax=Rhodococcus olei TaxID=2161675 RepID=A0ABP8NU07_9NOCA
MLRSLTRCGASVLVAAALVGGGLALGGGAASAQEAPDTGSSIDALPVALLFYPGLTVLTIGQATGSIGDDSPLEDCYMFDFPGNRCPDTAAGFLGLILTEGLS